MMGGVAVLMLSACARPCQQDRECDDGLICNGVETCVSNTCAAGPPKSCDDGLACTVDTCNEQQRWCESVAPDVDGDGAGDSACVTAIGRPLGDDCDDRDARRKPGNLEVCDRLRLDEDCDLSTRGGLDLDGDGYENAFCANTLPDGGLNQGPDCDDTKEAVHPGQAELCNFFDDNCNGTTDEGVSSLRFKDEDNDGWGAGAGTIGCDTEGTSRLGTDCDDANAAMHPSQFRCVAGSAAQYDFCAPDGGFTRGSCGQGCRPQPNGTGFCL